MAINAYQAVSGNNNAATLSTLTPQPRNNADLQYPDFMEAADSTTLPIGEMYVELVFSVVRYSQLTALLAAFGLSSTVFSSPCTVRLHTDTGAWANYNGTASYRTGKERGRAGGFWKAVTVIVRDLEAL